MDYKFLLAIVFASLLSVAYAIDKQKVPSPFPLSTVEQTIKLVEPFSDIPSKLLNTFDL
ncbi:hypothetical protein ACNVED_12075 [Legionella sp. D16C41]|uniref:hypothetical protein n=1 Tax=Legionella sp. D16C41 TaxID=3402688 RepID=UPI003AF5B781